MDLLRGFFSGTRNQKTGKAGAGRSLRCACQTTGTVTETEGQKLEFKCKNERGQRQEQVAKIVLEILILGNFTVFSI